MDNLQMVLPLTLVSEMKARDRGTPGYRLGDPKHPFLDRWTLGFSFCLSSTFPKSSLPSKFHSCIWYLLFFRSHLCLQNLSLTPHYLSSHFFAKPKLVDAFPRGIQSPSNPLNWSLLHWSLLPSPSGSSSLAYVRLEDLAECWLSLRANQFPDKLCLTRLPLPDLCDHNTSSKHKSI